MSKSSLCDFCGLYCLDFKHGELCKGTESFLFHTATYYTCDDSVEELSHETWAEAITEHLDAWHDPCTHNSPIDTIIAGCSPLKVYAYARDVVEPRFGEHAVDSMMETLDDDWHDNYGDLDGDSCVFSPDKKKDITEKFYVLMRECLADATSWRCAVFAEMEFDAEELTALMKKENPHWWEQEEES